MAKLMIRTAAEADVDGIYALENTCFTSPWSREAIWQDIVNNKAAHYYVAFLDDAMVGYAGIWHIINEGHITNVAVLPAYRKMGVASGLLNAMIDAGTGEGISKFTLEVRESNADAIKLYTKFKFEAVGIRPNYYIEEGEDALIMWLNK